mgnify:CR=1 FL=1
MENKDLKFLKKHYGEKFAHLCRQLFPTILEEEGKLSQIISAKFGETKFLYDDFFENGYVNRTLQDFKEYVNSFYASIEELEEVKDKSPEEIMSDVGYILYPECQTEEDIQKFKKYYADGEELCTFKGGRLNTCRVWFAVKKNADKLNRNDFTSPKRQDVYGTSVISIQFSRGEANMLSIKNRYNHTVFNPDATFSNNLDNIAKGLTNAFVKKYNLKYIKDGGISSFEDRLQDMNYVLSSDGKFYRYNQELGNIYYCENNVIIDNFTTLKLDKSKTLLMDSFIVDFEKKKIIPYCALGYMTYFSSFIDAIGKVKDLKLKNDGQNKVLIITPKKGNDIEITINKRNEIIGYSNPNCKVLGNSFMSLNSTLTSLDVPNVKKIGYACLIYNSTLKKLSLPSVEEIHKNFMMRNRGIEELYAPNLRRTHSNFLTHNIALKNLDLPKLSIVGDNFLTYNQTLKIINLPEVKDVGNNFFEYSSAYKISLPKAKKIGKYFMASNNKLYEINLDSAEIISSGFLLYNTTLRKLNLPKVKYIESWFMMDYSNYSKLEELNMPKIKYIGKGFLTRDARLEEDIKRKILKEKCLKNFRNNKANNNFVF